MKYLLLDKLRRLRAGWIGLSVFALFIGLTLPELHGYFGKSWSFTNLILILGGGIGLVHWPSELGAGYGRVVLTLPVDTQRLGRFVWFISVGMQTILFAGFSGLGFLFHLGRSSAGGLFMVWLQMVLLVGLYLGASFWISSGGPPSPVAKADARRQIGKLAYQTVFFAGAIAFIYWLYNAAYGTETKYALFCLPCVFFTFLGWNRAEGLLVDISGYRTAAGMEIKSSGNFRPPSGFGGVRFLLTGSLARQFLIIAAVLLVLGAMNLFIFRDGWLPFMAIAAMLPVLTFIFSAQEEARVLIQVKYLRALPLTSRQLAAVLLSITLPPFLLSAVVGVAVAFLDPEFPSSFPLVLAKTYVLGLVPLCVISTAAVWNSGNRAGRIVATVILIAISAIPAVYEVASGGPGWPLAFIIVYPLAALVAAVYVICRLLERDEMTYRFRPQVANQG